MDEDKEAEVPVSQSLESVTRKLQIKTKGKVFAVVRESYLRKEGAQTHQSMTCGQFKQRLTDDKALYRYHKITQYRSHLCIFLQFFSKI